MPLTLGRRMSNLPAETIPNMGETAVNHRTLKAAEIFNVPTSHLDPGVHDELISIMHNMELLSTKKK